jgi:hypothetical protein
MYSYLFLLDKYGKLKLEDRTFPIFSIQKEYKNDRYITSILEVKKKDLSLMVKHVPFKHQYLGSNPKGLKI